MSELLTLAEQCERATGEDWNLDVAIARTRGFAVPYTPTGGGAVTLPFGSLPRYTKWVDHAFTLLPDELVEWALYSPENRVEIVLPNQTVSAVGATRSLAICAAALKARAGAA